MIVMGIDPGSRRTGWGVVRHEGSRLQLVDLGILAPPADDDLHRRLAGLHEGLAALLALHGPDLVAVESVFHGPNTRSLVILGQARGALLSALGAGASRFAELTPAEVKKAVTGRGGAAKAQVAQMVEVMLGATLPERLQGLGAAGRLDATDALAVAIAAIHRERFAGRLARGLEQGAGTRGRASERLVRARKPGLKGGKPSPPWGSAR